jgi:acetate kinase
MRILTVNAGSTSLKLERYDVQMPLAPIAQPPVPAFAAEPDLEATPAALRDATREPIDVVAHRFVQLPDGAPAVLALDAAALHAIAAAAADDPLHDKAALKAVELVAGVLPGVRQFAVSDSAFHRTMGAAATTYALPRTVTGTHLHRLGYHGLNHEYVAHRGCALALRDIARSRVVTAHLGGGSSLCAVRNGASIDTTMGYTPLEGLPMATRSGSVDPGLLLHLLRTGTTADALGEMLQHQSGLLGISGLSGDVRALLAADNAPARLAIDVLVWRLTAALGAMIAVLGGVDVIVFTGGIGEHASTIRAAALANGLGAGVHVDPAKNKAVIEGRIDTGAGPAIIVVPAREGWQLARAMASPPNR